MKYYNSKLFALTGLVSLGMTGPQDLFSAEKDKTSLPNIIIIFTDDQGYGDLASFGNTEMNTPNTDRMAAEGMRFTDFYAAAGVSTPFRAALLTGCYPKRLSLTHRDEPFFVYLPHAMPHVSIASSHHFEGQSEY